MRILFISNVDWFFVSHFLNLAQRAKARGWDAALAAHIDLARERLQQEDLTLVELPTRRGSVAPAALIAAARIVADEVRHQPDTIIHGFGLFGITVGAMAAKLAHPRGSVYTITGRGYSAVSPSLKARMVRAGSRHTCQRIADGQQVRWLAENRHDVQACGLDRAIAQSRVAILGGAGIDPGAFTASPMPPMQPLRLALVARMIWTKGIDTAVAAVRIARERGADVTLTLAGGLDPDNPRGLTPRDIASFEQGGSIHWRGKVADINGLWAEHHAALLPSRGGEGIPKSLIEAAACGRPVLTSSVPGCREFAVETRGWHVPPDQPERLANEIVAAASQGDIAARGAHARATVLDRYTEAHNWEIISRFYQDLAAGNARDTTGATTAASVAATDEPGQ